MSDTITRDETLAPYAIADASGRITLIGVVPAFMHDAQAIPAGCSMAHGTAALDTDYVLNGAITARPKNPATLNGAVLSNLPNPSTVTINGTPYTVTDRELDMTFPNAGTYVITVSSPFPYLDASFTHTQ